MGMTVMTTKNSADLRVRDLKVLSRILRERKLTRAAELLDTTQPSISKVLAKLREHFADPLFVRDGHVLRHPKSVGNGGAHSQPAGHLRQPNIAPIIDEIGPRFSGGLSGVAGA
jgi:hypothetical protein